MNTPPVFLPSITVRSLFSALSTSPTPQTKPGTTAWSRSVTQMLDLNKKVQDARLEQEKTALSRQIEATDAAIDKLVYVLYGLTEEEIKIVEGAGK